MIKINIKNADNFFNIKLTKGLPGYILKKGDNEVPEEIYEKLQKDKWFIWMTENNLATIIKEEEIDDNCEDN